MAQQMNPAKSLFNIKNIMFLTLDTLFWSKKTLLVAVISVVVAGLSVIGRLILSYQWIRTPLTPAEIFAALVSTAILHFLVVLVALFYGTALISEEVESRTLTYLFTRPISKPAIMAGKFLALFWIGALLIFPAIVASYLVLYVRSDMGLFLQDVGTLGKDMGIAFLAFFAYGSFFGLLGAWLKHSFLVGLIYAFGWEGIVSYLPGFTRKLTITHYIQSLFPSEDSVGVVAVLIGERTDPAESVITLVLLVALFISAACLILREKEYVMEQ